MEAYFKDKHRTGKHKSLGFNVLSEHMHQGGGGYRNGAPPHGLSHQMHQGEDGYKAGAPTTKLQKQMGQ